MHDFLAFLKTRPLAWILPIVAFLALVAWIALRAADTPESPFIYRSY